MQVGFLGALALIASFLFETPHLPGSGTEWLVVLALALPTLAAVPADTVPYNTGTRHETCTALSTQAEQYYTDGAETLLKLSGSTSDSSLESMDSALYRALQSLMTDTMTDSVCRPTGRARMPRRAKTACSCSTATRPAAA